MKIAFFTDTYFPILNGVTISVNNFAEELQRLGHTVYIFAPKMNGLADEPGVIRIPSLQVVSSLPEVRIPIVLPGKLVKNHFKDDIDIIHAHGNGPFSLLGYQVANQMHIPFVLTFHTMFTQYTHYILSGKLIKPGVIAKGLKFSGNLCDAVVTPSEKMKNELISYGVKKQITVIPNFVKTGKLQGKKKGFLRQMFGIPSDSIILLSVGRLAKEKNFPFIIKAFKKVKADKDVHLVIVGPGPQKEELHELVKFLKLENRAHFTGRIEPEQMGLVYADADIFVFASVTEVQAVVILEAAASGLPFVVIKDGAYKDAIVDGVNGYLTKASQSDFLQKLERMIEDKNLQKKFGKKSKELIENNFNPQKLAERLLALYTSVIKEYRSRKSSLLHFDRSSWVKLYRRALDYTRPRG